jgi:16S rRNA (adenine1518-N6/adenine1519-N6)-dimethyltransferase
LAHRPKLGQHFLVKGAVLERLATHACEPGAPIIIEIGPGRGALTERLLARAHHVVAVEIDPSLVEHLRRKFHGEARLTILQQDILQTDLSQWGSVALAGNLPYFITSPILQHLIHFHASLKRAVLLVQKEVAARLAALPGTRDFGFLTVQAGLFFDSRLLFEVKPAAFFPPPAVDSAAVRLDPAPRAKTLGIESATDFLKFVGECFRHKRKTLRNNLGERYGWTPLASWPEASLRAEQISLERFAEMYHRLRDAERG